MNKEVFSECLDRLKATYGERCYPAPRVQLLWHAVKHLPDDWMYAQTNQFVSSLKSFPNVKEFNEEAQKYIARENERKSIGLGDGSFKSVLDHAAKYTKADGDFVAQCRKLLNDFLDKKITKAQFLQGCDLLDQAAALYQR